MVTKNLFFIFSLFLGGVCKAVTPAAVSMNIGGETRLYSLHKLRPNEQVQFQYPDRMGVTRCCLKRGEKSFELIETGSVVSDALGDKPAFGYRLVTPLRSIGAAPFLGIAVIGEALKIEQVNASFTRIKSKDGVLTVHTCTSQEGQHFIGELGGKIVTDLYYGFDYQISHPNCPPNLWRQGERDN